LDKAYAEKDKLEAKLEFSQAELGKAKAELEKVHGDTSSRYYSLTLKSIERNERRALL